MYDVTSTSWLHYWMCKIMPLVACKSHVLYIHCMKCPMLREIGQAFSQESSLSCTLFAFVQQTVQDATMGARQELSFRSVEVVCDSASEPWSCARAADASRMELTHETRDSCSRRHISSHLDGLLSVGIYCAFVWSVSISDGGGDSMVDDYLFYVLEMPWSNAGWSKFPMRPLCPWARSIILWQDVAARWSGSVMGAVVLHAPNVWCVVDIDGWYLQA